MGKTLTLEQLERMVDTELEGIPPDLRATLGEIDDQWDMIIYGLSGSGKSSFVRTLLKTLLPALKCRCEYVAYEEGHTKTLRRGMKGILQEIGNVIQVTDRLKFDELCEKMSKRRSPKVWVIDSIQASGLTASQFDELRERFVLSHRKKIIIYVSWADGKKPMGPQARSVEYWASIKLRVEGCLVFPKSRFGGNKPYVIWDDGAKRYWGTLFYKKAEITKPKKGG